MRKTGIVEKVKKDFTGKEFLREVLIFLYNSSTPADIFDSKFCNVEEKEVEFIRASADVSITYSCSVGYDSVETYLGEEEYRDAHNQLRKRIVEKTRTTTNWSPHNGASQTFETCFIRNSTIETDYSSEELIFSEAIKDAPLEACQEKEVEVSDTVLKAAEQLCGNHCFERVVLPGDKQKDVSWRGTAEIDDLAGILITEYSVKFNYNDNEYEAKAFASGKPKINCDAPSNTKDTKLCVKKVFKKTIPFLIVEISLILFALAVNIMDISGWGISKGILDVILVISFVVLVVAHIICRNVLIQKLQKIWKNKKLKDLNYLLRKFNLEYYE